MSFGETSRGEVTLHAPAKINLGLEVIRRRADGYHDLNTLFATVDLCDRLTLRRMLRPGISCQVLGNDRLAAEGSGDNLTVQAATLLLDSCGREEGVEIVLEKKIPVGAGLGGGSSDAAVTLLGLAKLLDLSIDDSRLNEIAVRLGSDVPFFLKGGIALASGQGEQLRQLDIEIPWSILLVNPGIHIPTPKAYSLIDRRAEREQTDLASVLRDAIRNPEILRERLINDFEEPVFEHWPEVATVYDRISETPNVLHTGMAGSGSTLFGLYSTEDEALTASLFFGEYLTHVGRLGRFCQTG